jgi:hypothetical protein
VKLDKSLPSLPPEEPESHRTPDDSILDHYLDDTISRGVPDSGRNERPPISRQHTDNQGKLMTWICESHAPITDSAY